MGNNVSNLQILDPNRFRINNIIVTGESDGLLTPLCTIKTSGDGADIRSDTNQNVEFVLDHDEKSLLLKIPYCAKIYFNFKLELVAPMDNVTLIIASSTKQLETFVSNELFHNPNLQNEDNVRLLGDFRADSDGKCAWQAVDFTWSWISDEESIQGTIGKKTLCFAEYNKHEHKLSKLASFTIVIDESKDITTFAYPSFSSGFQDSALASSSLSPVNIKQPSLAFSPSFNISPSNALPVSKARDLPVVSSVGSNGSSLSPLEATSPLQAENDLLQKSGIDSKFTGLPVSSPLSNDSINKVLESERRSSLVPRPIEDGEKHAGLLEDGPLFRATVGSFEKKNVQLKAIVKKMLKRAVLLHQRQYALVEAQQLFDDSLRECAAHEISGMQPLVDYYYNKKAPFNGLIEFNRGTGDDFKQHVVEPLRLLYEQEIKLADIRKREFEDESAQYYSWLSRYLSMKQEAKGKKKSHNDSKYLEKRRAFELGRFDYYSYLSDLHGGRKQSDIIYNLALFAEKESTRFLNTSDNIKQKIKPELDSVVNDIKEAQKDWTRFRTQRETQRRALEKPVNVTTPTAGLVRGSNSAIEELSSEDEEEYGLVVPKTNRNLHSSTGLDLPTPFEEDSTLNSNADVDMQKLTLDTNVATFDGPMSVSTPKAFYRIASSGSNDTTNFQNHHRKEGLLWSMSRASDPLANLNKAGWHKYWVVLAGGKLSEYTNWKQSLDLHNEPINLKTACVREARSSDRRFCFEIVTPSYKRVYQTTSDDDMRNWIQAVQNGISSSFDELQDSPAKKIDSNNDVISSPFSANGTNNYGDTTVDTSIRRSEPASKLARALGNQNSDDLLKIIQQSPSNRKCADCGTSRRVDWVSINLLVVLCIDCSGVHRSLGSHISKIRSLTLDTVSFTPELIDLLTKVDNAQLNALWEEDISGQKPSPLANRMNFITEKYVEKKYIKPLERPNAHLRKAVADQNAIEILKAFASRANPNAIVADVDGNAEEKERDVSKEGMSLLLYAFHCAPQGATRFPIVELLILNGASIPQKDLPIPGLSDSANSYLKSREAAMSRKLKINTESSKGPSLTSALSPEKKPNTPGVKKRLSTGFK